MKKYTFKIVNYDYDDKFDQNLIINFEETPNNVITNNYHITKSVNVHE